MRNWHGTTVGLAIEVGMMWFWLWARVRRT
jgi:hypothetical protein